VQSVANPSLALRLLMGLGFSLLVSFLVFRAEVFNPQSPMFRCVTAAVMLAALLSLMRDGRLTQAGALATAFALVRLGFAQSEGWTVAIAGAIEIGGMFLVALIFDLLARKGILFGKFLVLGPMLGGVYLATTQLASVYRVSGVDLLPMLMRYVFLGLLIGDSVGFGVEVADLLTIGRRVRRERPAG
jgi:hypothetical protein